MKVEASVLLRVCRMCLKYAILLQEFFMMVDHCEQPVAQSLEYAGGGGLYKGWFEKEGVHF